ncbi:sulfite exporter TauE/SafE family protein [Pleurocapsales cyanobacterium LEGE 06147]|nr:sulfite exporter TauE/SafE family protein [Pleurocapsales cyanobacterium LEGE 06147]
MTLANGFILAGLGIFSGLLAGMFGIGGGVVLVPIIKTFGYAPVQAVATSSLAIILTSVSGSIQNWRMGHLNLRRVLLLGLPSLITAQFGALIASNIPAYFLLIAFACFLIVNIFLTNWRKRISTRYRERTQPTMNPTAARIVTGGIAGLLAGLFGIGGGVIMVPLQMFLLGETIKVSIQTSLGVIVLTSISACLGHAYQGNVLWLEGIILGLGGLLGAQISTRFLPKLPDRIVGFGFNLLLAILAFYTFWLAWQS